MNDRTMYQWMPPGLLPSSDNSARLTTEQLSRAAAVSSKVHVDQLNINIPSSAAGRQAATMASSVRTTMNHTQNRHGYGYSPMGYPQASENSVYPEATSSQAMQSLRGQSQSYEQYVSHYKQWMQMKQQMYDQQSAKQVMLKCEQEREVSRRKSSTPKKAQVEMAQPPMKKDSKAFVPKATPLASGMPSTSPCRPHEGTSTQHFHPPDDQPKTGSYHPPLDLSVHRKRKKEPITVHSDDQPLDLSKKKRDSDDDDVILVEVHKPRGLTAHEMTPRYSGANRQPLPGTSSRTYDNYPAVNSYVQNTLNRQNPLSTTSYKTWDIEQKQAANNSTRPQQQYSFSNEGVLSNESRTKTYSSQAAHTLHFDRKAYPNHVETYPDTEPQPAANSRTDYGRSPYIFSHKTKDTECHFDSGQNRYDQRLTGERVDRKEAPQRFDTRSAGQDDVSQRRFSQVTTEMAVYQKSKSAYSNSFEPELSMRTHDVHKRGLTTNVVKDNMPIYQSREQYAVSSRPKQISTREKEMRSEFTSVQPVSKYSTVEAGKHGSYPDNTFTRRTGEVHSDLNQYYKKDEQILHHGGPYAKTEPTLPHSHYGPHYQPPSRTVVSSYDREQRSDIPIPIQAGTSTHMSQNLPSYRNEIPNITKDVSGERKQEWHKAPLTTGRTSNSSQIDSGNKRLSNDEPMANASSIQGRAVSVLQDNSRTSVDNKGTMVNWYKRIESAQRPQQVSSADGPSSKPVEALGKISEPKEDQECTVIEKATSNKPIATLSTGQEQNLTEQDHCKRPSTENKCTQSVFEENSQVVKSPTMVAKTESKFVSQVSKLIPVANVHPIVIAKTDPLQETGDLEQDMLGARDKNVQTGTHCKDTPSTSATNTCVMEVFKQTLEEAPQKIQITPNPLYSNHQDEFVRFIHRADSKPAEQSQVLKKSEQKKKQKSSIKASMPNESGTGAYRTPETTDSAANNLGVGRFTGDCLPKARRNLALHFTTPKGRHKLLAKQSSAIATDFPLSSATELLSFHPPVKNPNRPKPKSRKRINIKNVDANGVPSVVDPNTPPKVKKSKNSKESQTECKLPKERKTQIRRKKKASLSEEHPEKGRVKPRRKNYCIRNKPAAVASRGSRRSSTYDKNAAYDAELRKEEERKRLRRVRREVRPRSYDSSMVDIYQMDDSTDSAVSQYNAPTLEMTEEAPTLPELPCDVLPEPEQNTRPCEDVQAIPDGSVEPVATVVKVRRKYTRRDPTKKEKIPKKMIKKEAGGKRRGPKPQTHKGDGSQTVVKKRPYNRVKPLKSKLPKPGVPGTEDQVGTPPPRVKRAYRRRKDKVNQPAVPQDSTPIVPPVSQGSENSINTVMSALEPISIMGHVETALPYYPLLAVKPKAKRYPMQKARRRHKKEPRIDLLSEAALDRNDKKRLFVCREIGETTLHKAARKGYVEAALHCLDSGEVDVNVRDNAGYTPLHESCVSGNLAIAKALIDRGADPNAKALGGTRPIHDAVDNNHLEHVRLLLSHGADPSIANYAGRTPLKMARSTDMKNFLNAYFADLHDDSETVEIPAFVGKQGAELGFDLLDGAPSDDENEAGFNVLFDMSAENQPMPMCLRENKESGLKNYQLVHDVARSLGVDNPDDFILLNGDLRLTQLPKKEILEQLAADQLGSMTSDVIKRVEELGEPLVDIVEIDDVLCQLLEVSREQINKKDFALEQWFLGPLGSKYRRRTGERSCTPPQSSRPNLPYEIQDEPQSCPTISNAESKTKASNITMMIAAAPEVFQCQTSLDQRTIYKVPTCEVRAKNTASTAPPEQTNSDIQNMSLAPSVGLRRSKSCTSLKGMLPSRRLASDIRRSASSPNLCASVFSAHNDSSVDTGPVSSISIPTPTKSSDAAPLRQNALQKPTAEPRLEQHSLQQHSKEQQRPSVLQETHQQNDSSLSREARLLPDPGKRSRVSSIALDAEPGAATADPALPVLEEHQSTRPVVVEGASVEEDREMPELTLCSY